MATTSDLNKLVFSIGKRYGTFNPFVWADHLNIDVQWKNLKEKPLGTTTYYGTRPIVLISDLIKDSNRKYFVLAHEIGHVLEHKGLAAYYISNHVHMRKTEKEADNFAIALVTNLYIEENGKLPDTYQDLKYSYGLPDIGI